jgi:MoaA/NifB/PqqE/SkfB family radical SAM enzyme
MLTLQDNLFNARQQRHQPKLKRWKYAGLMLTYQCSAACRFCYYYCSPQAKGLMPLDTAIRSWQGLVRIAGNRARVHITGGEPFLYFDRMAQICKTAQQLGLSPVDSIETNADVWENAAELADKLRFLDACGLNRVKVSWDVFHEEFVDVEKVRQFVRISRQILGPDRVLVRWEKHLTNPSGIRGLSENEKRAALLQALASDPCRFTGRAARELASWVAGDQPEVFRSQCCRNALLGAKGVHIDPYGNVFNGQCSGMIVGNVNRTALDALWTSFEPDRKDFWRTLYEKGPWGLLKSGPCRDFHLSKAYASKCHLCSDIRRFFFDKGNDSMIIGPKDCYGRYD